MAKGRECYTNLRGDELVYKDHPSIRFRGKLDALTALSILCQCRAAQGGPAFIGEALEELRMLFCGLMRAHVLDEPVGAYALMGLDPDQLRGCSHNPKKHFGVSHFLPDASMGSLMALLNYLRTQVREVELDAVHAMGEDSAAPRLDIIAALNRASSAVYIAMCRLNAHLAGE